MTALAPVLEREPSALIALEVPLAPTEAAVRFHEPDADCISQEEVEALLLDYFRRKDAVSGTSRSGKLVPSIQWEVLDGQTEDQHEQIRPNEGFMRIVCQLKRVLRVRSDRTTFVTITAIVDVDDTGKGKPLVNDRYMRFRPGYDGFEEQRSRGEAALTFLGRQAILNRQKNNQTAVRRRP